MGATVKDYLLLSSRGSLLPQYLRSLKARARQFQAGADSGKNEAALRVLERLEAEAEPTWGLAHELEMELVQAYRDEAQLTRDLERRLVEAKSRLPPWRADYYRTIDLREVSGLEAKRGLMVQLLDDLQWYYNKADVKRSNIRDISRSINLLVVGMFVLCIVAVWYALHAIPLTPFQLVLTTAAFGGLGAAFSMLVTMRTKLQKGPYEETVRARSLVYVLSRMLIGVVGGLTLFFFIEAGYLAGDIFPTPAETDGEKEIFLAGMLVWSLVAGFSESLVPGLLRGYGDKAQDGTT